MNYWGIEVSGDNQFVFVLRERCSGPLEGRYYCIVKSIRGEHIMCIPYAAFKLYKKELRISDEEFNNDIDVFGEFEDESTLSQQINFGTPPEEKKWFKKVKTIVRIEPCAYR